MLPSDRKDRVTSEPDVQADGATRAGPYRTGVNGSSTNGAPVRRDRDGWVIDPKVAKDKKNTQFWRAIRFIYPYRRTVLISFLCAFFVGLLTTGGLTTMLPILRVLLNNQTVAQWVDSQVVEKRLGVKLADIGTDVQLLDARRDQPGAMAGLKAGDVLHLAGTAPGVNDVSRTLATLSDPAVRSVTVSRERGPDVTLTLPPVSRQLTIGRRIAAHISPRPVTAIAEVLAFIVGLAVIGNILKYFQEYLSDEAAVLGVNDIRRRLYDHILHIPMSHFGRQGTTDVTSRLVQDCTNLEMGFKTVLGQSIQEPIKAAMAFGLALFVSWKLTLIIVIFGPVMGVIIQKFGKKMRRASRAALQKSSAMLGQIEATLNGIRVVKGACAERFERRRYRSIMTKLIEEQLKMSRIDAFSAPTLETLTLVVVGIVLLIATWMVMERHTLSVTSFFLVMGCLGTIADSLRRLNKVNNTLQRSNAAAARIYEVLDSPVERRRDVTANRKGMGVGANGHLTSDAAPGAKDKTLPARGRVKLPAIQREVRFEDITFTYPGAPSPALEEVNLAVPKGQCVAVVGRNGSGKTTLLALLPRFYDPDSGRVTIDGVDVRDATLRSLRGQISIVTQDSVIFPGTIADNIAYGSPLAKRDQIISAAQRAFAHDFIMEKPKGYDTQLDGLGGQLSGGQKQRMCIARAILRRAPILILDEATSQVDAESEHLIQQAIEGLVHERSSDGAITGPTTFIIAHRFSTILSADVIVVMDRGRIVGQGTHEQLLRDCETYQQLYERQLIAAPVA